MARPPATKYIVCIMYIVCLILHDRHESYDTVNDNWIDSAKNFPSIESQQVINFGFTFLKGFTKLQ